MISEFYAWTCIASDTTIYLYGAYRVIALYVYREIVALSGAHALGRCHAEASGYVGPWTPTPTTFVSILLLVRVQFRRRQSY